MMQDQGHSGSPAFLKKSHELVGILYAGERDKRTYSVDWRRHERFVPIIAIIEEVGETRLKNLGITVVE